jgi:peptide deformylase
MSREIITDAEPLHQVSEPVQGKPNLKHVTDLLESFPSDALGLAAPQIGIFERMFVVNLSCGRHLFINPKFLNKSPDVFPSTEGCLSCPGEVRTVQRSYRVTITADVVQRFDLENSSCEELENYELRLNGLDAAVVQHEYDHLEGVLIIDLPQVPTLAERQVAKQQRKHQKIHARRQERRRERQRQEPQKVSPKRAAKLKKMHRSHQRKLRKAIRDEEEKRAYDEGIVNSNEETPAKTESET